MSFGNRCVTRRSRPATGLTAPTSLRPSSSSSATTPTSQAGLRLRRRMGADPPGTRRLSRSRQPRPLQQRRRRTSGKLDRPHDPDRQRATRIRRGDEPRVQEDRRRGDRGVQGRIPRPLPGPRRRDLTDEDLLREVMNTVGKPGKLGEQIRCVVSVSMLTEGWDANTVTHVLGVRAFGTQLLCEQVVGRALRRMSYAANDEATVRARVRRRLRRAVLVPPLLGHNDRPQARPDADPRSCAPSNRIACEITWPRLLGYRYELPGERLAATFTADSQHGPDQRRSADQDRNRGDRRRDPGRHARRPEATPAQRGRLPARQADLWRSTFATTTGTTSPGSSRNCSASPSAGSPSA